MITGGNYIYSNRGGQQDETASDLLNVNFGYRYENGLNLKPGSTMHQKIVSMVLERARDARAVLKDKYDSWNLIQRTLTAYMPASEADEKVTSADERKPVTIVVPMSYAVKDTILTYLMNAFLSDVILPYSGREPGDVYGAALLEHVIQAHCEHYKVALDLITMFGDGLSYGLGAVSPIWNTDMKMMQETRPIYETGYFPTEYRYITGQETVEVEDVDFEGCGLIPIDPWQLLVDPNVTWNRVQEGEFAGWITRTNRMMLLAAEQRGETLTNCKYLKHIDGRSQLYESAMSDKETEAGYPGTESARTTKPVDVIYLYATIIPAEWQIGTSEYPEKWFFAVAGDRVVVAARPLGLRHNQYPIAVCAPTYDGHAITPTSLLETVYGLQQTIDWFFKSHVDNVRKAINDMFLVDPYLVNMDDLANPSPGGFIRTRRGVWGRGVKDAMMQLRVNDVTARHMADIPFIGDMIQRVSGATDALQGVMRPSSERTTATESHAAHAAALSRMEKMARIIGIQAISDIARQFAYNTQQFMSRNTFVKLVGRYEQELRQTFNISTNRVMVSPNDINVNFDVVMHDGSVPGRENIQALVQMFQSVSTNPMIAHNFDIVRIFMHVMRQLGVKTISEFVQKGGQVNPQVVSDEEAVNQAQRGNLLPLKQTGGMVA